MPLPVRPNLAMVRADADGVVVGSGEGLVVLTQLQAAAASAWAHATLPQAALPAGTRLGQ
jgi:methionyl-tRNA formyltransferase